jgi:hypothetical protein
MARFMDVQNGFAGVTDSQVREAQQRVVRLLRQIASSSMPLRL